jgi:hypothetical protein
MEPGTDLVVGQAAGFIHMTCQPWLSRTKKLREYMKT